MLRFDNTHIFTGYLKQKLSSINIPTCKIYTREYEDYYNQHGVEDPRIVESIDTIVYDEFDKQLATRVNYLRGNSVYNYFHNRGIVNNSKTGWYKANNLFYDSDNFTPGLTKTLNSPGVRYDQTTHEYLGEYLRFLRDYNDINLMSLYNCFNNVLCNNLNIKFKHKNKPIEFSSYDSKYRIYAFPVKLFSKYTIAIDSHLGVEIFCGFYNSRFYGPNKVKQIGTNLKLNGYEMLGDKTYVKTDRLSFSQPILYDKLAVENWLPADELKTVGNEVRLDNETVTRWDILSREQDLKMFIKIPVSCHSSIVVLEGDFRNYNNSRYLLNATSNLNMTGCSFCDSSYMKLPETPATKLKGFRTSAWQFGYYSTDDKENNIITGTDEQLGWIVPSINYDVMPTDVEIWDGITLTKPRYSADFDGCPIYTASELAFVIAHHGNVTVVDDSGKEKQIKYFRLMNDIYLNDISKIDWTTGKLKSDAGDYHIRQWFYVTSNDLEKEENNPSEYKFSFSGTLDGNGSVVFGLYFKSNYEGIDYSGLIPAINGDKKIVLKNLGLSHMYISCSESLGFIGAKAKSVIEQDIWKYEQNCSVVNLKREVNLDGTVDDCRNALYGFKPISKLQLLEFNTGESFPFADRLLEYLCGSAIMPTDKIPDNIQRLQRVMEQNGHYFSISGLWEPKMQKILYDYIMSSGPIINKNGKLVDMRTGYHPNLGHKNKSLLYDVLGYGDKDVERWYASVRKKDGKMAVRNTAMHVDIYDGLYAESDGHEWNTRMEMQKSGTTRRLNKTNNE